MTPHTAAIPRPERATLEAPAGLDLHAEHLRSPDDLDRVRDAWDGFVERCGSDIYFTVDWLQAWWDHYGHGRTFEALIVRDGARIVGALPFSVQRLWAGPVPVRLARFAGADSTFAVLTPAIAAGYEEPVLRVALDRLLGDARCHAVSLWPLSGDSRAAAAAERVAADRFGLVRADSTGPHMLFRLPESFADYLAGINRYSRRDYRRSLRHLDERYEISSRTVSGDDAVAYLDRFVELHTAHWRAEGKLGHFGDWPASVDFTRDLIARMAASGRARFYEIAGDGEVLAIEQCFVFGDRCHWRLAARDSDPELERLGLGRVGAAELLRAMIEAGLTIVEAGPGHYEYKARLGAEEHPVRRVVIGGRTATARWRGALLLRWADLLNLVYYRAWFLKIAPRLGRPRRALWRPWIRTRM
jgi:CelD/BcsL family acetyltransferase involved in cellulose biosynthesis